jgi:hypothetical protein
MVGYFFPNLTRKKLDLFIPLRLQLEFRRGKSLTIDRTA